MSQGSSRVSRGVGNTSRRRLEALEALLAAAPLGLGLLDSELRYVWVNPVLAALSGVPIADHVGRTVRMVCPALADCLQPGLCRVLAREAVVVEFGDRAGSAGATSGCHGLLRRLDSPRGNLLGIAIMIVRHNGEPIAATSTGQHEGEQWHYRFLEAFAHELKNPLTPVLHAAQMLQCYGVTKPEIVEWDGLTIERQVRQMNAVVNEAIDLARAATGKLALSRTSVDLKRLLERALASCRDLAEGRGVTVDARLPDDGLHVCVDVERLSHAIQHVLAHAVAATAWGRDVKLGTSIEGADVLIRISVSGRGLDVEALDAIVASVARTDDPGLQRSRGVRMGLALARALIELHGGTLRAVRDRRTRGLIFVTRLPAAPPPVAVST